jgi:GH25 family lysozyme M1 (1,4-beta-N-acetylmuramidase)
LGSTLPADTLRKLKNAQGPFGAHLGQGLKRLKEGLSATVSAPTGTGSPVSNPVLMTRATAVLPAVSAAPTAWMAPGVQGLDVSGWQGSVDWQSQWNQGARFAYTKATEGTTYISSAFGSQYTGAADVGMIRGAYHFALPSESSGADQARFFVSNGGGWSPDGVTLPPLLDIEYNPYSSLGDTCYNMSAGQMVGWIQDFVNTMVALTGRLPAIYTTADWWSQCTGNSAAFGADPLHIASYSTSVGPMPNGWNSYNVWQYSSAGPFVGDSDAFNGSSSDLASFATNDVPAAAAEQIQAAVTADPGLGSATSPIICGLAGGGCYQIFEGGVIHWSPATGAHITDGAINTAWAAQGWENGGLGYPTSNEIGGLKDGGVYQNFQGGVIHWSPATGAHITRAAIDAAWAGLDWENGFLGYPTSNEIGGLKDGGVYQSFQGGVIYWSAGSGAHSNAGAIRTAYASQGWENGLLGYPTTNEYASGGGVAQDYQGGRITWSGTAGTAIAYK